MKKWVVLILCGLCISAFPAEVREFTDVSGRAIEASIVEYHKGSTYVRLMMKNGRAGKVPLSQLSEEDCSYLEAWASVRKFTDPDKLSIEVNGSSTSWTDLGDGRDEKETTYTINITNHSTSDFEDIRVEYCIYDQREHYIGPSNRTLSWTSIPAGKSKSLEDRIQRKSFRRKSNGFLNETVGIRVRVITVTDDGLTFFREASYPENLPVDEYPWTRGDFERNLEKDSLPAPEDYPEKQLSEDAVRAIGEAYVKAFMNDDQEAFQNLLRPMHPGDRVLDNHMFHYYHHSLAKMNVVDVDGLNVKLELRNKDHGHERTVWLMLSPSGHIKYSPYLFQHPLDRLIRFELRYLLHEELRRRQYAFSSLKRAQISTFKYDPKASVDEQEEEVYLIMEWLHENGGEHDTSEPHVFLPPSLLKNSLNAAEQYIKRTLERN